MFFQYAEDSPFELDLFVAEKHETLEGILPALIIFFTLQYEVFKCRGHIVNMSVLLFDSLLSKVVEVRKKWLT